MLVCGNVKLYYSAEVRAFCKFLTNHKPNYWGKNYIKKNIMHLNVGILKV